MSEKLGLGQIITTEQHKDAIHVAVVPVTAAQIMEPGTHFGIRYGKAVPMRDKSERVGVVDPFLLEPVMSGQQFWGFLYPGSITSLRHAWTHPAFPDELPAPAVTGKSEAEVWMRAWAVEHMGYDYYGDGEKRSDESAYAAAIEAGRRMHIGPYESARDHIDSIWWDNWEEITGQKGNRGEYFSCSC